MMKIAFTSCCDPWNDPTQAAWLELQKHTPDVLILLGDNMYMDYGMGNNPLGLYKPKKLSLSEFSDRMHTNYLKQWNIKNFYTAISNIQSIYAIWDDHDFAWNNSYAIGTNDNKKFVPSEYRILSRKLFEQFRNALKSQPKQQNYPNNPCSNGIPEVDLGSIEATISLMEDVRLHLIDGRSFRPKPDTAETFLGQNQKKNIENEFKKYPHAIHIIASGTTLTDWETYSDFLWLKEVSKDIKVIVLSGDIHVPAIRNSTPIFEFTASAMAQTDFFSRTFFGRKTNVFGILDVNKNSIDVEIFQFDQINNNLMIKKSASINRTSWLLDQTI